MLVDPSAGYWPPRPLIYAAPPSTSPSLTREACARTRTAERSNPAPNTIREFLVAAPQTPKQPQVPRSRVTAPAKSKTARPKAQPATRRHHREVNPAPTASSASVNSSAACSFMPNRAANPARSLPTPSPRNSSPNARRFQRATGCSPRRAEAPEDAVIPTFQSTRSRQARPSRRRQRADRHEEDPADCP